MKPASGTLPDAHFKSKSASEPLSHDGFNRRGPSRSGRDACFNRRASFRSTRDTGFNRRGPSRSGRNASFKRTSAQGPESMYWRSAVYLRRPSSSTT
jgi:hypothetical protein